MSCPYSETINKKLIEIAINEKIMLHQGVYASVQGPNLETRAEYRLLKIAGADAVECNPENLKPVDINEIIAIAGNAEDKLIMLYTKLLDYL